MLAYKQRVTSHGEVVTPAVGRRQCLDRWVLAGLYVRGGPGVHRGGDACIGDCCGWVLAAHRKSPPAPIAQSGRCMCGMGAG